MADQEKEGSPTKPLEIHKGVVMRMEEDYSEVELINPNGQKYRRNFETPFLTAIGIKAGDDIQLEFEEKIEPGVGTIIMKVRGLGPLTKEEVEREVAEIMSHLDMKKIQEVFDP